ncbi:MAG: hypothetical protein KGQ93_11400 [Cyanobacteria bacterium REEB459]|nr:hypothetical protein [Cyanobacteria bacterium REEB459]
MLAKYIFVGGLNHGFSLNLLALTVVIFSVWSPAARADSQAVLKQPIIAGEWTDDAGGAANQPLFELKTDPITPSSFRLIDEPVVTPGRSLPTGQALTLPAAVVAQSPGPEVADRLATPSSRPTPPTASELRQNLQIPPVDIDTAQFYYPGSGTGIPEGFGARWGDIFVTVFGSSTDKIRTEYIDSSISMGLGLGDPRHLVGLELSYNILSTRTAFALNGSFDIKLHRYIVENNQLVVSGAVGVNNLIVYGPEAALNTPTVYGVVSGATYLRPEDPTSPMLLTLTLGAGGAPYYAVEGTGLIAGAGVELNSQVAIGSGWNGTGFGLGASYVPFRNLPITITALYQDIFDMTPAGHKFVLSVDFTYSFK